MTLNVVTAAKRGTSDELKLRKFYYVPLGLYFLSTGFL